MILPFLFAFAFAFLFFLTAGYARPAPGKVGKEEDRTFPWSRAIISLARKPVRDHKQIILWQSPPILLVEAHFSFKLCYNHLAIKSIDLTSEMYSDLLKQDKFNLIKYYLSIELSKPIITPSLKSSLNKR